jgi:hypothetical protein
MNELYNKTFLGEWRELDSNHKYIGSLSIDLEGHSRLFSIENYPIQWQKTQNLPDVIVGNFCESFSRKNYTIILKNNIGSGLTMSKVCSFYLSYEFTMVSEKIVEDISSLEFNYIHLASNCLDKILRGRNVKINSNLDTGNTSFYINQNENLEIKLFDNLNIRF